MQQMHGFILKSFLRVFNSDAYFFVFRAMAGDKEFEIKLHRNVFKPFFTDARLITASALLKFGKGTKIELAERSEREYVTSDGEVRNYSSNPIEDFNEYLTGKKLNKFGQPVSIWTFDANSIADLEPSETFLELVDMYSMKALEHALSKAAEKSATPSGDKLLQRKRVAAETARAADDASETSVKPAIANIEPDNGFDDDLPF